MARVGFVVQLVLVLLVVAGACVALGEGEFVKLHPLSVLARPQVSKTSVAKITAY